MRSTREGRPAGDETPATRLQNYLNSNNVYYLCSEKADARTFFLNSERGIGRYHYH